MSTVVVLNTTYEPIHTTSVKHAIGMLWRGVAVAIEEGPETFAGIPVPKVLKLVRYVKMAWRYAQRRPTCSTVNVLARDRGRCAYCGEYNATTFDHVMPRARGGTTSWDKPSVRVVPATAARGTPPSPNSAGCRCGRRGGRRGSTWRRGGTDRTR